MPVRKKILKKGRVRMDWEGVGYVVAVWSLSQSHLSWSIDPLAWDPAFLGKYFIMMRWVNRCCWVALVNGRRRLHYFDRPPLIYAQYRIYQKLKCTLSLQALSPLACLSRVINMLSHRLSDQILILKHCIRPQCARDKYKALESMFALEPVWQPKLILMADPKPL